VQGGVNSFYFAAGAVFSASALVLTLAIPARALFELHDWIPAKRLDYVCRIVLFSGTVVGYAYLMELFMAYYSASKYEGDAFLVRARFGPSVWYYSMVLFCNVVAPQFFWFKRVRQTPWAAFAVSIAVNIGMLYERYVTSVASRGKWGD
jgi:molybdopterin-containing oxidoreductase family membrane subunit